jgi:hypothetical protein
MNRRKPDAAIAPCHDRLVDDEVVERAESSLRLKVRYRRQEREPRLRPDAPRPGVNVAD